MSYKDKQRQFADLLKPVFYPKGAKVLLDPGTDKERELPNAAGNYFMGKGFTNRRRYRQRYVDRRYTTQSTPRIPISHKVRPSFGKRLQLQESGVPRLANYVRHQISKANRAVKKGVIQNV